MRTPILTLTCVVLLLNNAQSEKLKESDREILLDNLEKIQEAAKEKVDSRFLGAITAFRNAMSSDSAAFDLFLNCKERIDFTEKYLKESDFREWKRAETEPGKKMAEPGFRLALRHQLRWLMLTLEAASANASREKLSADAIEVVEAIFNEPAKLAKHQDVLGEDVTKTVFARAYNVEETKVEDWTNAPGNIGDVFDKIILPPYRKPNRLAELRSGWIRRIELETIKMEHWTKNESGRNEDGKGKEKESDEKEEKRVGTIESLRSPAYTKFIYEGLPQLQWQMEMDLFKHGDENGASVRMLAHIEKHIHHTSAKQWTEELQDLLKPQKPQQ
jgi:hypothetical protein